MTTNRVVDSSFTAIITASIDKIDIPTWMPPIVSTLMDIRVPRRLPQQRLSRSGFVNLLAPIR